MEDKNTFFKKNIRENYLIIGSTLFFAILSLLLLFNHEPWRDEGQAWLFTRDSKDLLSVLVLNYEVGPNLWHLLLYPFVKVGLPFITMAILNFILIMLTVIIWIKYAPFTTIQKVSFLFGYYIFYEYNAIARSYVLTFLFLVCIAAIYQKRFRKPKLYSLFIILLASSNIHSLVMAFILFSVYIFEFKINLDQIRTELNILQILISIFLMFLGILISLLSSLPPLDDLHIESAWSFDLSHFIHLETSIIGAFIPLSKIASWNYQLLYDFPFVLILLLPMLSLPLLLFIKKPIPAAIYVHLVLGLLVIFFFKYASGFRHFGLIFMVFIFSVWIAEYYEEESMINFELISIPLLFGFVSSIAAFFLYTIVELTNFGNITTAIRFGFFVFPLGFGFGIISRKKILNEMRKVNLNFFSRKIELIDALNAKKTIFSKKNLSKIFTLLLIIQIIGSPIAFYNELYYDFSGGKKVADYLTNNNLLDENTAIAVWSSPPAASILPYLPSSHSQAFLLDYEDIRKGSYMIWNTDLIFLNVSEVLKKVDNILELYNYKKIILILNQRCFNELPENYIFLTSFENTLVNDESFYLFVIYDSA